LLPEKPSVSHHANNNMTVKMMMPVLMCQTSKWSRFGVRFRTGQMGPSSGDVVRDSHDAFDAPGIRTFVRRSAPHRLPGTTKTPPGNPPGGVKAWGRPRARRRGGRGVGLGRAYCCDKPRPSQHANSTITVKITSPVVITHLQSRRSKPANVHSKTRRDDRGYARILAGR